MLSAEPSRSSRRTFFLDAVVIALVAVACYLPLLRAYFRDDDWGWLIVARGWQQNPAALAFGHTGVTPFWNVWFRAVFERAGIQSASPYFALNIGLHALNSVLVAVLARLLMHQRGAALVAGLTFAVLFCHHEAVGWIASGPRVLEACCGLTALNAWLLLGRGATWTRAFGPLSAMLTPLAKESGIIIGPLALLTGFMSARASNLKSRREALIWFALPYIAYGAWRWKFPPRVETIAAGGANYFIGPHVGSNLIYCVPQMLVPDLRFANYRAMLERALPPVGVQAAIWGVTILILGLFGASLWLLWRGDRLIKGSVAWCYVAFLPFAPFIYGLALAPRYLYVPSVGLSLLLGVAWTRLNSGRKRALWMLLSAFWLLNIGGLSWMARNRIRDGDTRREIIRLARQNVPDAPALLILTGLPPQFFDLKDAIPLFYRAPIKVQVGNAGSIQKTGRVYVLNFAPANSRQLIGARLVR